MLFGYVHTKDGCLIPTVPLPSSCHNWPIGIFNADACAAVQNECTDTTSFIYYAPTEVMNPYFQNQISTRLKVDIVAGLDFAHEHNVRLVIKNTGHDFAGKSASKASLSLWMHNVNTTEIILNLTLTLPPNKPISKAAPMSSSFSTWFLKGIGPGNVITLYKPRSSQWKILEKLSEKEA
ncbi:uncharacterized protein N7482_009228 [Penicillium canariense]|uniref:FAD linked oxidase N-terminal domain-containing protein n=1 Tax=Penicillium canariense TaxID=189055 RepID=A0A9W9LG28_9EURO|nr:uncharacterized protein N7482_009228 [Penicillium canariense]KAJ5152750.1 hypothetical protein N7482_009228 [Penicillium canariense]